MESIIERSGDIHIENDYYPWIVEIYLHEPRNIINILGSQDVYTYRSKDAKSISFEPVIHTEKPVKTIGIKGDSEDNRQKIIYPDGSVISDDTGEPDLDKIKSFKSKI